VSIVRWNLKEADGVNDVATNRNRIGGRLDRVTHQDMNKPGIRRDVLVGRSGDDFVKEQRLTLGGLMLCCRNTAIAQVIVAR